MEETVGARAGSGGALNGTALLLLPIHRTRTSRTSCDNAVAISGMSKVAYSSAVSVSLGVAEVRPRRQNPDVSPVSSLFFAGFPVKPGIVEINTCLLGGER